MSWERASSPSFMIAPLPNCFSIWLTARSIARSRFTSMLMCRPPPAPRISGMAALYLGRQRVSSADDAYFQPSSPSKRMVGDRDVDGPRRSQAALVEHHLRHGPGAEDGSAGGPERLRESRPTARGTHAPDRQMAPEGTDLGRKAEPGHGAVHHARQLGEHGR